MTYFLVTPDDRAIDIIHTNGPKIQISSNHAMMFSDIHEAERKLSYIHTYLLGKDKRAKTLRVSTYAKGWMNSWLPSMIVSLPCEKNRLFVQLMSANNTKLK